MFLEFLLQSTIFSFSYPFLTQSLDFQINSFSNVYNHVRSEILRVIVAASFQVFVDGLLQGFKRSLSIADALFFSLELSIAQTSDPTKLLHQYERKQMLDL